MDLKVEGQGTVGSANGQTPGVREIRRAEGVPGTWTGTRLARRWLAAMLVAGLILPAGTFAQTVSSGRARGMAERAVPGRSQVPNPDAKLTLRVYNYASVDAEMLARAEGVAGAIFEESGIGIAWMDCTPVREKLLPDPACSSDMGASDLVLRLLPRRMAMKLAAPNEPLGYAQQCPETEPACELTVFCFRVEEVAAEGHGAESLLGHVIAHEVAHVLIGPGHSYNGIMRREWSREELRRISLGLRLGLSNEQSRQLQAAVLRRMKVTMTEDGNWKREIQSQGREEAGKTTGQTRRTLGRQVMR